MLDDVPLDRLRDGGDEDPTLVQALRRVVAAATGSQDGNVARFNNFI